MGSLFVVPRIPSVPKNLRVMPRPLARLADPAPEACRDRMNPGDKKEENRPAGERNGSRVSDPAGERDEGRLRGPFVPRLAELPRLLAVLPGRASEREDQDRTVEHQRLRHSHDAKMDDRPNRKAPHHRVARDPEYPGRAAARPRRARESRVLDERAEEQD